MLAMIAERDRRQLKLLRRLSISAIGARSSDQLVSCSESDSKEIPVYNKKAFAVKFAARETKIDRSMQEMAIFWLTK